MRNIIILLIIIFVSFYSGYIAKPKIDTFDFSRLLPFKEKVAIRLSKDLVKTYNTNNMLDSSVSSLYCMNTKTNIIQYYPKNMISTNSYELNKNLHCIYSETLENIFKKNYYKNKPQIESFVDNHIKGYTD